MNKEDAHNVKSSDRPESSFENVYTFRFPIWEDYSLTVETGQLFDKVLGCTLKKLLVHQTMDLNKVDNKNSISPQLSALLDLVISMEAELEVDLAPVTPSLDAVDLQMNQSISTANIGNSSNSLNQENKEETDKRFDVDQEMNNHQSYNSNMINSQLSDEEEGEMRLPAKRSRLPGIEQVTNKKLFANNISHNYTRTTASGSKDAPFGTDVALQHLSNQRLQNPENKQTSSPTDTMPSRESNNYPNLNLSARTFASEQMFDQSNELGTQNVAALNQKVSECDPWRFPNVCQGSTSSLIPTQAEFQNILTSPRDTSPILQLDIPPGLQSIPSINNPSTAFNNNSYMQHKNLPAGNGCSPVPGGTMSPKVDNTFPPNAMVTRSCSYNRENKPTLIQDNYHQKNVPLQLSNSLYSSSMASSKVKQNYMRSKNRFAQNQALGPITQSPTYQPNVLPSYNQTNSQGIKTTVPILGTNATSISGEFPMQQNNFIDQPNFQFPFLGSSARQGVIQRTADQIKTNPTGINLHSINCGSNENGMYKQGFSTNSKPKWSGLRDFSTHSKSLNGFPTPISTPGVQEYPSPRSEELPPLLSPDIPCSPLQQFTSPCPQQFPYSFNPQFRTQSFPSTSTQAFTSAQFAAPHEQNPPQYPLRFSDPAPAISTNDLQMFPNNIGTNQRARNVSQPNTPKAPRKRRVTKAMTIAQIKRTQKQRKQVQEKLLEFIRDERCDQQTITIISKHVYHVQNCNNWVGNEECPLCTQIIEMVMHATECQKLNCPFLYCRAKALILVAKCFSDPKFVYGFLKELNVSEKDMKEVYVLKKRH